jgi:hypothetical protein
MFAVGNTPGTRWWAPPVSYGCRVLDTTPLTLAVDHFADRLRAAPQSRLQRNAAAEALGLARELARRAQVLEGLAGEALVMPDAGMFAVADQVVVAVHDLAVVLASEAELAEALVLVGEAQKRAGV